MTVRTTARLLMLVCLAGLLVWFAERRHAGRAGAREAEKAVLRLASESVNSVILTRGDFRADLVRQDGGWYIQHPIQAQADDGVVDRLLSALEAMRREDVISAAEREKRQLTAADYELEQPRIRLIVRDALDRWDLLIGRDSPMGDLVYVQLGGSDDVIATSRSLLDAIPSGIGDIRDRTLLRGRADRTGRVDILRPKGGLLRLSESEGRWMILQPVQAPADTGRVTELLDALYSLRAIDFVWDPPPAAPAVGTEVERATAVSPVQTFGLADDEAVARIHVWPRGDQAGKELVLGKPADAAGTRLYAKLRESKSVYTVDAGILRIVSPRVNELRDRLVFALRPAEIRYASFEGGDRKVVLKRSESGAWMMLEPGQWNVDEEVVKIVLSELTQLRVKRFVDADETNLWASALREPDFFVEVLTAEPPPQPSPAEPVAVVPEAPPPDVNRAVRSRLVVGRAGEDKSTVFARFENQETIFELEPTPWLNAFTDPVNPLLYRDRTMLAVQPDHIRKIILNLGGKEQAAARDEGGDWQTVPPQGGHLKANVIEDILLFAVKLRARSIEVQNPPDLAPYGLDKPEAALTLGLSGGGGIQKTILFGRKAPKGIYAMVQGQDIVFVLGAELAELLRREFVEPAAPADSATVEDEQST